MAWSIAGSGQQAGKQGLLGTDVDEAYGGGGVRDFRYNAVAGEELVRIGASGLGFGLHNDVVAPYLLDLTTEEQKRRWLPGFCSGDLITAIAMSEPSAGSDLQGIKTTARRNGSDYIVNGSKTFITNGILSDLVIVVARTDVNKPAAQGLSLVAVERGHARLRPRPQPGQGRPQGPGHRRVVLRQRPHTCREPDR
ncbi:MAG: acyl-CoA dehydrogenase family protein [Geodermatophilaceae bacterium]